MAHDVDLVKTLRAQTRMMSVWVRDKTQTMFEEDHKDERQQGRDCTELQMVQQPQLEESKGPLQTVDNASRNSNQFVKTVIKKPPVRK